MEKWMESVWATVDEGLAPLSLLVSLMFSLHFVCLSFPVLL